MVAGSPQMDMNQGSRVSISGGYLYKSGFPYGRGNMRAGSSCKINIYRFSTNPKSPSIHSLSVPGSRSKVCAFSQAKQQKEEEKQQQQQNLTWCSDNDFIHRLGCIVNDLPDFNKAFYISSKQVLVCFVCNHGDASG